MLTDLKTSIQSAGAAYTVVSCGQFLFIASSLFVIAKVKIISERKFIVRPLNILGPVNVYLMLGKYHFHYKMLEDDVIDALRKHAGKNTSIILD